MQAVGSLQDTFDQLFDSGLLDIMSGEAKIMAFGSVERIEVRVGSRRNTSIKPAHRNLAACGNVVSLETFMRIMVSSLPQGRLAVRFPGLQLLLKRLALLVTMKRRWATGGTQGMVKAVGTPS